MEYIYVLAYIMLEESPTIHISSILGSGTSLEQVFVNTVHDQPSKHDHEHKHVHDNGLDMLA